ncbi:stretch-activated Ca2+-permeable channel component-domain-containing protein [Dendryphion nanum]|uniref:Stretch-activated Ca2+-permeable channel component-domain-containing protein n=1 Tax=Dendryphion nanum TaxID=256645 RepID=A0A9P9DFE9_9PLEO|nr:stretch-activated Ca2+-permeable channel component-domain-containing protein [Dendryphion nanum]
MFALFTTAWLLLACALFQSSSFVHATQSEPRRGDSEWDAVVGDLIRTPLGPERGQTIQLGETVERGGEEDGYLGNFAYFDRSLIGRAPEGVETLENNVAKEMETAGGEKKNFVLEISGLKAKRSATGLEERTIENVSRGNIEIDGELEVNEVAETDETDDPPDLKKRQNQRQVFISINTCRQPGLSATTLFATDDPPQLTLYISNSPQNQRPGPDATNNLAGGKPIPLVQGYATYNFSTSSDVFIGVSAPNLTVGWAGSWSFEVAASVDGLYHSYNSTETLVFLVDSDYDSALFVTPDLTGNVNNTDEISKWTNLGVSPFTLYAFVANETGASGVKHSLCGLKQLSNNTSNFTVNSNITTNFGNRLPKGQFHVDGLKKNTTYVGYLAIDGNMTKQGLNFPVTAAIGPGGRVWTQFEFSTKNYETCQVIFGLTFCDSTAYAVPSSPQFRNNDSGLGSWYDDLARQYYQNFNNSLDQIACDTTDTAQYSLARTCVDCRTDYKEWLCSVVIPRCEDYDADGPGLQPRNINAPFPDGTYIPQNSNNSFQYNSTRRDRFAFNQSRNPQIDKELKPGPYQELLPCEDLCFDIVRSCPAKLGFVCPNQPAMKYTYAKKINDDRKLSCNFPGAVTNLNPVRAGAEILVGRVGNVVVVAGIVALGLWI